MKPFWSNWTVRVMCGVGCAAMLAGVSALIWRSPSQAALGTVEDGDTGKKEAPLDPVVAEKRRIGRLLLTLKPGMTQQQVEAILGPPEKLIKSTFENQPVLFAEYRASPPNLPPIGPEHTGHFMSVVYDARGPVPIFTEVGGPSTSGTALLPREEPGLSDATDVPDAGDVLDWFRCAISRCGYLLLGIRR